MINNCWYLELKNISVIIELLYKHLKQKWNVEIRGIMVSLLMILLSLFLPFIASNLYKLQYDSVDWMIIYSIIAVFNVSMIVFLNSGLNISRILYEIKYTYRLSKFLFICYRNILKEHNDLIKKSGRCIGNDNSNEHDIIITNIIFKRIFGLYFDNMAEKMKNSEPYLIDIKEMHDLYTSKEFKEFYSSIFFSKKSSIHSTSYEKVLIHIIDDVLTELYQRKWFVEYYDDNTINIMVNFILSNWYFSFISYTSSNNEYDTI